MSEISSQVVKCWSCSEVPNGLVSTPYIIWKSAKMANICREYNHYVYPISFHDRVKCVLCNVDNLDPNDLGIHYHHPLVGMTDWENERLFPDEQVYEWIKKIGKPVGYDYYS